MNFVEFAYDVTKSFLLKAFSDFQHYLKQHHLGAQVSTPA